MLKPPPPAEEHDFLADNNSYAGVSASVETGESGDTALGHLLSMRRKLVIRRRQFAADANKNPVVYLGRAIDIRNLQKLIRALDEAIEEEIRETSR
ncbi:hypothetical protein FJ420_16280 [Mesorhizobium sp. B3-1-3]|uniref:hypothetical protein n=1 Tax=unclassified Mesorhizobium TaxID=325217 RepID=UPI00112A0FB2|nr:MULTISPECIES: hypothetical protein [unclassified Mesorhizobium]TPI61467.1 hypothetical protein FJ424_22150 [Mesorhizobium sp. B3-1-8]TPI70582.1 hypothetical protein FJ420_16280 [Mesorhizobium sp. B3-1-3]